MCDWQHARLGDVLSIKHGFAFKSDYFVGDGPFVVTTPGNFHEAGGFKYSEEKRKGYGGPIPDGYILQENDLLVAMTEQAEGLLGSTALAPVSGLFLHNQRLGLIRVNDPRRTDKRFVYYLFNSPAVRQQIRASASGTKVRHTSPSRIGEVAVFLPPFAEQVRIADILSAYEDLIQNNTRRIAILEEMARLEEWFVHFRAPGCESLPMVDSAIGPVPQRWEVTRLKELASIVMGQSPKSNFYNNKGEGLPFHQGVTDFGEFFPSDRVYCTEINQVGEPGDILISVRAPVGRIDIALKWDRNRSRGGGHSLQTRNAKFSPFATPHVFS